MDANGYAKIENGRERRELEKGTERQRCRLRYRQKVREK